MADVAADLRRMVEVSRLLPGEKARVGGETLSLAKADEYRAAVWPGQDDEPTSLRRFAQIIYQLVYTQQGSPENRPLDLLARRDHIARLSEANQGKGTWEPRWTIRSLEDDGRVVVERDGVSFWAAPSQLRVRGGGELAVGAPCQVQVGKELREIQQGFYIAIGNGSGEGLVDEDTVLRFYWHLKAAASVPFIRAVTTELNALGLTFRAKVLSDPRGYHRADAGVLFMYRRELPAAREALVEIWKEVRGDLRSAVPMLTRTLAPGLGLATNPGGGRSFGQDRCLFVARALLDLFEESPEATDDERLDAVASAFRTAGIDPARPELEPGEEDPWPWPFLDGETSPVVGRRHGVEREAEVDFLAAAKAIGDTLCRTAWWHEERCTWVGRTADEAGPPGREVPLVPTCAPLGGSLYDGTAGVGLFLAELGARTAGERYLRTARGAFRLAFERLRQEAGPRLGFHNGPPGIAWAALRAVELGGAGDDLREASARVLADAVEAAGGDLREHVLDLMDGQAGAALVLLDACRMSADETWLAGATALGEEICRAAETSGEVWTWDPRRAVGLDVSAMLTGLSHGAAGLGLALHELAAVTGKGVFRHAARGAFVYEATHFDAERGNWLDLRELTSKSKRVFMTAWCHGAPGIVLSRLRALELDPENAAAYRPAIDAGLATTRKALARVLDDAEADTSLCHGTAGLGEVLLIAGRILGDATLRDEAEAAGRRLVAMHGASGEWPSGVASRGPNPSLMLGLAGVGHWLLRLQDPEGIPSVLLPGSV